MNLLAYNLIRILMAKSAKSKNLTPRDLSFKNSLQGIRVILDLCFCLNKVKMELLFKQFFINISKNVVAKRPNRREPRAVKRRYNPVAYMMKPRAELRKELKITGS